MRKTIIGGLAMLATLLLNAQDTKVSYYNNTIDEQLNNATQSNNNYTDRSNNARELNTKKEKASEQKKWNKLSTNEKCK